MKKTLTLLAVLLLTALLTACGPSAADAEQVLYLNPIPEADAVLRQQAARYTKKTGTPVKIVTPTAGTYSEALSEAMSGNRPPAVFCLSDQKDLDTWAPRARSLSRSPLDKELLTDALNLYDQEGTLKALPMNYEAAGLIVNLTLLEQAGYTVRDISDFASLKAVADDIHSRIDELDFDAFTVAGLDRNGSRRFSGVLSDLALYYEFRDAGIRHPPAAITGAYLDHFRQIWDLYITDCFVDGPFVSNFTDLDSRQQFLDSRAVFYQGSSSDYTILAEQLPSLTILPLFCGAAGEEQAALWMDTACHWAISIDAALPVAEAAMDFLCWLVSDPEAAGALTQVLGDLPYRSAPTPDNAFLAAADALLRQGRYPIPRAGQLAPNPSGWGSTVVKALTAYAENPCNEIWAEVFAAFVDGWAYEYKMEHYS